MAKSKRDHKFITDLPVNIGKSLQGRFKPEGYSSLQDMINHYLAVYFDSPGEFSISKDQIHILESMPRDMTFQCRIDSGLVSKIEYEYVTRMMSERTFNRYFCYLLYNKICLKK